MSISSGKTDIAYMTLNPHQVKANAALIVRAVNNHAALVAVLERCYEILPSAQSGCIPGSTYDLEFDVRRDQLIKDIPAALAAAKMQS